MAGSRSPSRAALLELREERQVVADGHRFLDEKRALLAHEVLERLGGFGERLEALREREQRAAAALAEAVASDGLEGVQLSPPATPPGGALQQRTRPFLGIRLAEASALVPQAGEAGEATAADPPVSDPSSSARAAYAGVVEAALPLAAELGNLVRLMREFQHTQRRVRALEKVVLPELQAEERQMQDALEEIDQEDAIRVRLVGRGGPGGG